MARPRKPLELHLIKNTYRRDRHGPLPGSRPEPALSPPEPEAYAALDADARARLAAWRITFDAGYDFFSELEPLGIVEPCRVWPLSKQPAARRAFMKAAREAWHELGAAFLAQWKPHHEGDKPWALEEFGSP
jgi:hypothetical protein